MEVHHESSKTLSNLKWYFTESGVLCSQYHDGKEVKPPFIVYQEMNKKPDVFGDDYPDLYILNVQITLVSKEKDVLLENTLEQALLGNDLVFTLLSEYRNEDKSLSRVYEIKMEEFTNGK